MKDAIIDSAFREAWEALSRSTKEELCKKHNESTKWVWATPIPSLREVGIDLIMEACSGRHRRTPRTGTNTR